MLKDEERVIILFRTDKKYSKDVENIDYNGEVIKHNFNVLHVKPTDKGGKISEIIEQKENFEGFAPALSYAIEVSTGKIIDFNKIISNDIELENIVNFLQLLNFSLSNNNVMNELRLVFEKDKEGCVRLYFELPLTDKMYYRMWLTDEPSKTYMEGIPMEYYHVESGKDFDCAVASGAVILNEIKKKLSEAYYYNSEDKEFIINPLILLKPPFKNAINDVKSFIQKNSLYNQLKPSDIETIRGKLNAVSIDNVGMQIKPALKARRVHCFVDDAALVAKAASAEQDSLQNAISEETYFLKPNYQNIIDDFKFPRRQKL